MEKKTIIFLLFNKHFFLKTAKFGGYFRNETCALTKIFTFLLEMSKCFENLSAWYIKIEFSFFNLYGSRGGSRVGAFIMI